MVIPSNISTSLQVPQLLAEISGADEAGGMPGSAAQSPRFGQLLEQWTAAGDVMRLPADSARNEFPRSPLKGDTFVDCALCDEQSVDTSRSPVQRSTETSPTGVFSTVIAAADIVRLLPEQEEPGPATALAEGVKFTQGQTPGERGLMGMQKALDLQPMAGKRLHGEENATNGVGELPVAPAKEDHHCFPAEVPQQTGKETTGKDSAWIPLLALGNPYFQGNVAKPLPELSVALDLDNGGQVTPQTEKEEEATAGSAGKGSAGAILSQDNVLPENQQHPACQPDFLAQAAAGAATGNTPADTATTSPGEAAESLPSSVIGRRSSVSQAAALYRDIYPGSESAPAKGDSAAATTMQTGPNQAVPQTEGDTRGRRDIPLPPAEATGSKVVSASNTQAGASLQEPLSSLLTTDPRGKGRVGEAAGNAYRSVAAEAVPRGKNGALSMPDNSLQAKPASMPGLTVGDTTLDPQRIDIVFAEETGAERKEPGGEGIRKSQGGKSAGSELPTTFAPGSGELRGDRESRISSPAGDARIPLAEQIHSQIREKLDANGNGSNNNRITLRLHPEELGELKINMRMEEQRLKVEIVTDNQSVKDALMQNLDTLKETLSRQNIAMDRFNVSADLRQGSQQGARDGRQATQDNRGTDGGFRPSAASEEDAVSDPRYHWENENSLVNLVL